MRDRIFSSVLLPAPFRPMTPMTSPCSTSNETSRRAQKLFCSESADPRERTRGTMPPAIPDNDSRSVVYCEPVPSRYRLPKASALTAIELTASPLEFLALQRGRFYTTSAKVDSIFLKYSRPPKSRTTTAAEDTQIIAPGLPPRPSREYRKPSMTPAIGFRPYQARYLAGTRLLGYTTGVANNQNCVTNGMTYLTSRY